MSAAPRNRRIPVKRALVIGRACACTHSTSKAPARAQASAASIQPAEPAWARSASDRALGPPQRGAREPWRAGPSRRGPQRARGRRAGEKREPAPDADFDRARRLAGIARRLDPFPCSLVYLQQPAACRGRAGPGHRSRTYPGPALIHRKRHAFGATPCG